MSIRVHDLTVAALAALPTPCRSCLFWETTTAAPGGGWRIAPPAPEKLAWWQATQLEWGPPGKAAYANGELIGYALFAPARHFPRTLVLGPPPSDDALLLATMWVEPGSRRAHVATTLLQSVLRETARRGARALEAYGLRGMTTDPPMGGCLLPEGFLVGRGFALLQDNGQHPLFRLDMRQTARWQESFGHAVEGVLGLLSRRERAPAPSPARTVGPATARPGRTLT